MNATVEDLRATIIPKSDQLNAEQLLGGPMTVTITDVRLGSGEEQPVVVHYEGESGRPFKPCKTMRKVLIHAWGADGRKWSGRSMTLYNDHTVKWAGEDVGGIRISHLTHIDRDIKVSLTTTRGKKAKYEVRRLESQLVGHLTQIAQAPTMDALKAAYEAGIKAMKARAEQEQLAAAKDKRKAELSKPADTPAASAGKTLAEFKEHLDNAIDIDMASVVMDEANSTLDETEREQLAEHYRSRWA
jgi:hypothetical protein